MDCVTGVLEAESIYSETKEWKDQKSVRPNETRLSATHGIKSGASRLNSNVEMWLEKHSCVSASVEYFAGFSIVTLIFGPNFPDVGQLRPILVDFGRLSPIQGRIRSRRAKGNHQPPTQLQRLP